MSEIRLQHLKTALAEHGHVNARLAERIGKSPAQISQWLSGYRSINEDTARQIERRLFKPAGWMDGMPRGALSVASVSAQMRPPWPFQQISESALCSLSRAELERLESSILLVADALRLHIKRQAA